MSMNINVGGTWKSGTPFINVAGTWKPVETAWTNVGGSWKEFYKSQYVYNITSDLSGFLVDNVVAAQSNYDNILIHIQPNVKIYAPALKLGGLEGAIVSKNIPSGKTITIINDGEIYGRAGTGGTSGFAGGKGGDAVTILPLSSSTIEFYNNGIIYGGSGGGGGGGNGGTGSQTVNRWSDYVAVPFDATHQWLLTQGYGFIKDGRDVGLVPQAQTEYTTPRARYKRGSYVSGTSYRLLRSSKIVVTETTQGGLGGLGGTGQSHNVSADVGRPGKPGQLNAGKGGQGGTGGLLGQAGSPGSPGTAGTTGAGSPGGQGGAPGAAINGVSNITLHKSGTTVGAIK